MPGWEINMKRILKCKLKSELGRLRWNIKCHYSLSFLAKSLGAFLQCSISSLAVPRLLSPTTLGLLCLFISEMTLSHLAVSSPPTSCSASVLLESNALERQIVEVVEGKGCHELNLRQNILKCCVVKHLFSNKGLTLLT